MIDLLRTEFGLAAPPLEPLSGGRVNRLWHCGRWVVKVYDHRQVPRERAQKAIHLQQRAAAEGLPVPIPRQTATGALWAESDDGLVVVMPYIQGLRRARGALSATEAANLGRLIGTLHALLRNLPLAPGEVPRCPTPDAIRTRWEALKDKAQSQTTDFDQVVIQTADYVSAALGRMPPPDWDALPWQLCHGDLHLDNLLFDDAGRVVGLLDFDNAGPFWPGVELMMAWNLCFSADPRIPGLSPEAAIFFARYSKANPGAGDLSNALRAYWFTLVSNTWPAAIRYREGIVKPVWAELIATRLAAARWLEANMSTVTRWFEQEGIRDD